MPVLTGTTCGLASSAGKRGLGGHRQPAISWTGHCQGGHRTEAARAPWVSPEGPLSVLGLKCQSRVHTPGQDLICCPKGSFLPTCLSAVCPRLPVCPEDSVLVSLSPSVSPVSSPGPSMPWVFRQSRGSGLSVHLTILVGPQRQQGRAGPMPGVGPALPAWARPVWAVTLPSHLEPARGASTAPRSPVSSQ